jgi:hypothetical protein
MTQLAALQTVALVVWGLAVQQPALGLALAGLRVVVLLSRSPLELSDRTLNRIADITLLAILATFVGLMASAGLPDGLLAAFGWLPLLGFALMVASCANQPPLRMHHVARGLRGSTQPHANQLVELGTTYLVLTVLAASVVVKNGPWFFWAAAALLGGWVMPRKANTNWRRAAGFALALVVATVAAWGLAQGLRWSQAALQDWFVDAPVNTDNNPYKSQTRIGDLGRIKLSQGIVWRVERTAQNEPVLLLRSGVFTRFVDGEWLARTGAFATMATLAQTGAPDFVLHGSSQKGGTLLPLPMEVGAIAGALGTVQRNAYGIVRLSDAPGRLQARVWRAQTTAQPATPQLQQLPPEAADLVLPPQARTWLERLPQLQSLSGQSAHERVQGLRAWFDANFRYTLFLGDQEQGGRDLDRFLLQDRAGHCEYFGTATVLLLRALGIPARYVTGYSVQEYSKLEGMYVLRLRHAHAWAQAYVDGRWVDVDTTPSNWLAVEEDSAAWWQPLSDGVSFIWQSVLNQIDRLRASQSQTWNWLIRGLALALGGYLGIRAFRRNKPGKSPAASGSKPDAAVSTPELLAFAALEQEWAALGLGRHAHEPPRSWLLRVARDGASVVDAMRVQAARQQIESLYVSRYG